MTDYDNIETRIRIGRRIAELRKSKGISTIQMAEFTGLRRSTIWRIESGKFPSNIDLIGKIACALGCRLDVIEDEKNSQ